MSTTAKTMMWEHRILWWIPHLHELVGSGAIVVHIEQQRLQGLPPERNPPLLLTAFPMSQSHSFFSIQIHQTQAA
jgi:hypothetical protein